MNRTPGQSCTVLLLFAALVVATAAVTASETQPSVLFRNVTVMPMDRERVIADVDLLVEGQSIAAIGNTGSLEVPERTLVVEGEGRYLMPGLVDMHVHIFSEDELALYLAKGVTTARNMWGWSMHIDFRERIRSGDLIGPSLFTTGALVDGDPPQLRGSAVAPTPADAERVVAEQVRQGFDAIKVYNKLTPDAYGALILASRKYGVHVVGHVPSAVGIHTVLAAGQRTLEHLWGIPSSTAVPGTDEPDWSSKLSPDRIAALAEDVRRSGAWVTPTLVVQERGEMTAEESQDFLLRPEVAQLPKMLKRFCCSQPADAGDDLALEERTHRSSNRREVVRALRDAGVPLLLGSDTGNAYVLPGHSIHEEIRLLLEAGLTPYEVLRAGTRNAAEALGELAQAGTIELGKRADLILVSANPLEDPSTVSTPVGVMARGRWHSAEELRAATATASRSD